MARIRGRRLQAIRRELYAEDPTCAQCSRLLVGVVWQVDHRVPLCKGGKDDRSNRQLLCDDCHRAKTAKDMGHRKRVISADGYPVEGRGVSNY